MALWLKILIIILVIAIAALIGLYILGTKLQKKQAEQQSLMESMAQTVSLLVIDKKKMKFKDAGFPKIVYDQSKKYLRRAKVPVVKAKIGPKIMTLMCDEKVFEVLPVKQEARVVISGIYITGVKSVRGSIVAPPPKKKGLFGRRKAKDNNAETKTGNKKSK